MKHRTQPAALAVVREQRLERRAELVAAATRRSQIALALRVATLVVLLAVLALQCVLLERLP